LRSNVIQSEVKTERLFSYGTLKKESVQIDTFKRRLEGSPDVVVGYRVSSVKITDSEVIKASGTSYHPILRYTGESFDKVNGVVFSITANELQLADSYEAGCYKRIQVLCQSGLKAWVYIEKTQYS